MGLIDARGMFAWAWVLAILVFLGMAAMNWREKRKQWAIIGLSLLAAFVAFVVLTTGARLGDQHTTSKTHMQGGG